MKQDSRAHGVIRRSSFEAPSWAKNRHVQTIWPRFLQKRKALTYHSERITLPDNDFVDLAWGPQPKKTTGMVVIFHGLEGGIKSHYANDMMAVLSKQGWQVVLMHFRGCSGEPNRLPRAYHSGDTEDACYVLSLLEQRYPNLPKVAMGFSLGGNMLLKLLGENPAQHWLSAAISISAPLKLAVCAENISQGFSRVYQKYLLASMKRTLQKKLTKLDYHKSIQLTHAEVDGIEDFSGFDDKITAPLHGFKDAQDYYEKCSAYHFLSAIHCPTLILHAVDDPFMSPAVIPKEQDLARNVTMEISETGGHVGFMYGTPWNPKIWLHERVERFIEQYLPKGEL